MAKASESALHRSTKGWSAGRLPSLRKRRSSDSEAQRYWVGLSPICAKARRQAWISGSSLSAATAASRDLATAANRSAAAPIVTVPVMPSAYRTAGTSCGKSRQMSSECWNCMSVLLSPFRHIYAVDSGSSFRHPEITAEHPAFAEHPGYPSCHKFPRKPDLPRKWDQRDWCAAREYTNLVPGAPAGPDRPRSPDPPQ